jgi:hypothetical protein
MLTVLWWWARLCYRLRRRRPMSLRNHFWWTVFAVSLALIVFFLVTGP